MSSSETPRALPLLQMFQLLGIPRFKHTTMVKIYLYCKIKGWYVSLRDIVDAKFTQQFGFRRRDASFDKIVHYMYTPKDSASLAVTRILFGLCMLFDIPDERGGAIMDKRWGNLETCHFPLLTFIQPLPMPYMALVYAALWLGALGMTLGYKYRLSSVTFNISYWYLFLIEKSFWNNHSYLFGLVGLLMTFTQANCRWSIDVYLQPSYYKSTVPYWNYFILKYQFFILYFVAGLKKGTAEWLTGYSMQKLSEHWVFSPFRLFLTVDQTDYLVVHWFIFVFDLTVALWMMWSKSRPVATVFCALFHLMNSRLFTIGMFPWVCLATMPLFYPFDWPIILSDYLRNITGEAKIYIPKFKVQMQNRLSNEICDKKCECENSHEVHDQEHTENTCKNIIESNDDKGKDDEENYCLFKNEINDEGNNKNEINDKGNDENKNGNVIESNDENKEIIKSCITEENNEDKSVGNSNKSKKLICCVIGFYMFLQAFLPYSHFITKGYNNWTNGLYGYSWDMMVQTWDIDSVILKVVDNTNQEEFFIDPYTYTPNTRWTRHGDMIHQYATCLQKKLQTSNKNRYSKSVPSNFSIYIDVWCSMNGRFTQRMFDPKVDLLKTSWSPFQPVSFLMPLIDEALHWRQTLSDIRDGIYALGSAYHVIFQADFPGYDQEKFIPTDLENVSLIVLGGELAFEPEKKKYSVEMSHVHTKGDQIIILPGTFHKVINTGDEPAFYMYIFKNITEEYYTQEETMEKPKLPIASELSKRFKNMYTFAKIVFTSTYQIVFGPKKCH